MTKFVSTNWFNLISLLMMLLIGVRTYTYNETTVKSFMLEVKENFMPEIRGAITDLKSVTDKLQSTVTNIDKNQAVDKECINRMKEDITELKIRRNGAYVTRQSNN